MQRRYLEAIKEAKRIVVQAVMRHEPGLEDEPLRLDERVRELTRELGKQVLSDLYAELSDRVTDRAKGQGLTVQRRPHIEVLTVFGVIGVSSPYLWNRSTRQSARPVKAGLGLQHRKQSPALQRALTDFGAEESFAQADRRLQEHYGFAVGRTTVLRVVHKHARGSESYVAQRFVSGATQLRPAPCLPPRRTADTHGVGWL